MRCVPGAISIGPSLRGYPDQAKADDQQINGQEKVRSFAEQRTTIVNMNALIIGTTERHVTAPLICNYPIVHDATHDAQHLVVKEEVRSKARWIKGHREKVAMPAAVRLVAVGFEISEEDRPERASAGIDQGPRKMFLEYAIAFVADLDDLVVKP